MCGIAGEWDWGDVPRAQSALVAMIDSLVHRGPEGRTCWLSPDRTLALGYAQLSFFKGAKAQPISNRRNTIFAVCNGEIYNYRELAGLARQPELRSDIEVIPYLYELRGPSSFALLQGEFAFALYDCENQSLYLVRDGFGIKPLYYHTTVSSVVFASEIKAQASSFGDQ
jgi:asparagine synthase (glutamine-hydrolysing)